MRWGAPSEVPVLPDRRSRLARAGARGIGVVVLMALLAATPALAARSTALGSGVAPAVTPVWTNVTSTASALYTPPNAEWSALASLNGQLWLFGGYTASGSTYNSTYRFNTTGHWDPINLPRAPSPRFGAALSYDPKGACLVLFGGLSAPKGSGTTRYFGDTWTYNGTGSWANVTATAGPGPAARYGAAMAYDPNLGGVLLFGGYDGHNLSDTWLFRAGTWTQLHPSRSATAAKGPYDHLSYDTRDRQLILLGHGNETWTYANRTWTELFPATSPPGAVGQVLVDDPHLGLVAFGGYPGCSPGPSCTASAETYVFHAGNWRAYTTVRAPVPEEFPAAAYDPNLNEVVLFGSEVIAAHGSVSQPDTWTLT